MTGEHLERWAPVVAAAIADAAVTPVTVSAAENPTTPAELLRCLLESPAK